MNHHSQGQPLLQAEGLKLRFGGIIAADGIDLSLFAGEHLAIIGPNGAGKTTFLNICTGYLKPDAGKVSVSGQEITGRPPRRITRMGVARAFQIPQLFTEQTVLENMLLAGSIRERRWNLLRRLDCIPERVEMEHLLDLVGCADVRDRLASELPEGKRKLVDIALALALKPKVLLMDEPTSGVASADKFGVMETLMNALREAQVSSVFVEHDMEMVKLYATRVAVWAQGVIQMTGEPEIVLNDPDVIRNVIGS
ncbi:MULTISPECIES: ABC transporter ATP-binding protein [unclassified Paracoccus (in: a-proteobacteria)]|uniref:ABC transporter ATP-binding protein n=1 Tax=unclassified Paracoccus (in: a-proteobacteria) TaxID=2688777 RepID=UPI0016048C68|nr:MULTISPECIES: ABC transporter ATP-binding protein [unclassified Paracoccus (in: a-proteobacteria)]MBB1493040.1 ABC transporter ATP-binding protein [Paracoccus sp. MC1854]MBB1499576.1 ABC transporter ATP-binding protein [Paracoccus sp. MC1862]QQO45775.1 ABC transporter ATP-binding protein [Paracoccus sp. MC1862]